MIDVARAAARRLGLQVEFLHGDLRSCRRVAGTLGAIYFTFDVYSFVPGRPARIGMLREMRRWLRPDGIILVSARRFERAYDTLILTLQRAVRGARGAWGESHTRWISSDGGLHRSFVQVFTRRAIRREAEEAGLQVEEWRASHCLLRARPVQE